VPPPYWGTMPMSSKGSESTHARCTGAIGSAQLQLTVGGDWLPAAPPPAAVPGRGTAEQEWLLWRWNATVSSGTITTI